MTAVAVKSGAGFPTSTAIKLLILSGCKNRIILIEKNLNLYRYCVKFCPEKL